MSRSVSVSSSSRPDYLTSLAERMDYLLGMRAGLAVVVLGSGVLAPGALGASFVEIGFASALYLGVTTALELVRRRWMDRGLVLVSGMLLLDGVFVAWVMYLTGGTQSPLRFLAYVHVIGVTLLASYRTGLKIAVWHSLLIFVVFYAQASGVLQLRETFGSALPRGAEGLEAMAMLNVAGLWAVALGAATFSALNERELRRRNLNLEQLAQMVVELESAASAPDIARMLVEKVSEAAGFSGGVVLGFQDGRFHVLTRTGGGALESADLEPGTDSTVERAWETRDIVLVKRLDSRADPRLAALLPSARRIVVMPLFAEGSPVGVAAFEQPVEGGDRIRRWTVSVIVQFASHAALALRNAWLLEEVQRMAEIDPLTGVANRRTFQVTLERELSRSARNQRHLSLVMIDVDHFKRYNDAFGHQSGDELLREMAQALAENSRGYDVVARGTAARYGGEEFAVILPECTSRQCRKVAERLREAASKVPALAPVTVSAGVATFPSHAADAAGLVKAADKALYRSKGAGRDRLTVARRSAAVVANTA